MESPDCWGKHDKKTGTIHLLHAHLADVAAVFEQLVDRSPLGRRLAAAMGTTALSPLQRASLVYLAALHDVGKVNHGFQEMLHERPRLPRRNHHRFLLASLAHDPLVDALEEALAPLGVDEEAGAVLLRTAVAHHGMPLDAVADVANAVYWKPITGVRDPLTEIRRLAALAQRWSGLDATPAGPPLVATPALTHLFAGILTLADWIGSTESIFPFLPDADPACYWETTARPQAAEACAGIGVTARVLALCEEGDSLLRRVFPAVFAPDANRAPTPLQRRVATMPLPEPGTRLLVESETGSGKTEAALTLYARLRAAGHVGGLVFALPTRATASAMEARVRDALPGIYGDSLPSMALAVGGTQPHTAAAGTLEESRQLFDEEREGGDAAGALACWASERAKRFMAAEIVVGTLDQLLLAALPVRHAHLRLAGLTRSLLVVDELHAYDRFMTGVLRRLLDLHTAHGGMALFMSATLADAARREFGHGADAETPCDRAVGRPYPSLSVCPAAGGWAEEALPSPALPKRVHWGPCTLDDGLARAVEAARSGARVLVLRNTVRGARAVVDALHDVGAGGLLWSPRGGATPAYHSRYAPPDRLALDEAVRAGFGPGAPGRGVVLVATQVAEQSLDVDFDLLVTDLCPVDVLLQRIGRLWRHVRGRPAVAPRAQAWVVVPDGGIEEILATRSKKGSDGWGTVYPDLGDLELTHRLVRDEAEIEIPRDNRRLVEAVYHPEPREALAGLVGWGDYLSSCEGKEFATVLHARDRALNFATETYPDAARRFSDALEARIRTRLGDDRVRLTLGEHRVPCRYAPGETVDFVDLPEDLVFKGGIDPDAPVVDGWTPEDDAVRFRLGGVELRYGNGGWEWTLRAPTNGA